MRQIRFIRFFVLVGSLGIIVTSMPTLRDLVSRRSMVKERREELEQVVTENKELEKRLAEVQGLEHIERVARDKLGMVKEGETVVILPRTQNSELNDQAKTEEIPNWKKWWRLFF